MLDFVLRPEKSFMDPAEVAERPKAGRLHVAPGNVMPIARGLLSRRLLRPLRDRDLIYVAGKSLPNAFFGVGKGTYIGKEAGKAEGQEVRHLIMNLTCPSKLTFDNCGDIAALPFYGQWKSMVYGDSGRLFWSLGLVGHVVTRIRDGKKDYQDIGGHLNHIAGFKRELSSVFRALWGPVRDKDPANEQRVYEEALQELIGNIVLLPSAQLAMALPLPEPINATDASETGRGRVCSEGPYFSWEPLVAQGACFKSGSLQGRCVHHCLPRQPLWNTSRPRAAKREGCDAYCGRWLEGREGQPFVPQTWGSFCRVG